MDELDEYGGGQLEFVDTDEDGGGSGGAGTQDTYYEDELCLSQPALSSQVRICKKAGK